MSIPQDGEKTGALQRIPIPPRIRTLVLTFAEDGQPGHTIKNKSIDLTEVLNGDDQVPLNATVIERCDLGHWHEVGSVPLPRWSE